MTQQQAQENRKKHPEIAEVMDKVRVYFPNAKLVAVHVDGKKLKF